MHVLSNYTLQILKMLKQLINYTNFNVETNKRAHSKSGIQLKIPFSSQEYYVMSDQIEEKDFRIF